MPRTVDEMPKGRKQTKWDEYLDGKIYEFVFGEDFQSPPANFANCARTAAGIRNLKVNVVIQGHSVFVQSLGPNTDET